MRATIYAKRAYLAYSAVLIALGVSFLVFRDISLETVARLIGGVTLVCGAAKFISYFVNDSYGLAFQFDFALGIFTMVVGAILLLHPLRVLATLNVVLGLLIVIDASFKLQTAKEARHFGLKSWWVLLLLAILTAAAGILLVCNPFTGISALAVLIGVGLVVYGAENLFVAACTIKLVRRYRKQRAQQMVEAKGEES